MSCSVNTAWSWLHRELDRWQEADLEAKFWWRDDDATSHGDRLHRLLTLGRQNHVPLALAVIPAICEDSLTETVCESPQVTVLQHGYAHANNAAAGALKVELGGERQLQAVLRDLQAGYDRLHRLFGKRFCPVLVPPWNRIDQRVFSGLGELGVIGISTYRVCKNPHPRPGLLQVNTHIDPVNWRHDRGFIGVYPALAILVQHLVARRTGYRDFDEPTGILSHHLVYNDACWKFTQDLFAFLNDHPAASWTEAERIWQTDQSA